MKKILQIVLLLLGVMTFTAATVKAEEKPDTVSVKLSNIPIFNKTTNTYMYTNGQILACFHAAMPAYTFTSFTRETQGSDVFLYGHGYRTDSPTTIFIGYPIDLKETSTTFDIDVQTLTAGEGSPSYCTPWMCPGCEYIFGGRTCNCKYSDPLNEPHGRCGTTFKPYTSDNSFVSQLQQFTPIQQ